MKGKYCCSGIVGEATAAIIDKVITKLTIQAGLVKLTRRKKKF